MSNPYGPPPEQQPEQPGQQPLPPQYGQQPYAQTGPQSPYGAQQPPYGGNPYGQQRGTDALTADERLWGGAAHWGALISAFVAMAFLAPLIVLFAKGNESQYVRAQAVESLNFQLTMLIYAAVAFVLVFLLVGFLLLPLVGLWWLVFTIIGSVRSANGDLYRYPLTIRMVS